MLFLSNSPTLIKRSAIYPSFDKVQVWLKKPIRGAALQRLQKRIKGGCLYSDPRPSPFSSHFRQRLEF